MLRDTSGCFEYRECSKGKEQRVYRPSSAFACHASIIHTYTGDHVAERARTTRGWRQEGQQCQHALTRVCAVGVSPLRTRGMRRILHHREQTGKSTASALAENAECVRSLCAVERAFQNVSPRRMSTRQTNPWEKATRPGRRQISRTRHRWVTLIYALLMYVHYRHNNCIHN
ncbi:hypothetical protein PUN28_004604 [Cardiocondyla obscurior]|uniref:Uncharacterized protein n=1 Tax=Cardiocondyla obscurior TaxID=286306 RepID=A0AAW2GGN8_9HYME